MPKGKKCAQVSLNFTQRFAFMITLGLDTDGGERDKAFNRMVKDIHVSLQSTCQDPALL